MPIVQLEHAIHDFEGWKAAFDSDPIRREQSGVQRYRVFRPVDDANYVIVELDFETLDEAERFCVALQGLWRSPQAAAALAGQPRARIVETAESVEY